MRGAFAGVRPVLDSGAEEPSKASREEAIWEEAGLLSVAGGKLTTWRTTAREVVDAALDLLPAERAAAAGPCATGGLPLAGLAPADLGRRLAAGPAAPGAAVAAALARRLGATAWSALQCARGRAELAPLAGGDLCAAEVRAHARFGAVLHLDDLLLRRARVGMWQPALARDLAPAAAAVLAEELGWDGRRRERELEACAAALVGWSPEGVVAGAAADAGGAGPGA